MKFLKKLLMLSMVCMMTLTLTGCDDVPTSIFNGIESSFTSRVDANLAIVNSLYSAKLISENSANLLKTNITNEADKIKNGLQVDKTASKDTLKAFARAIVGWRCVPHDDGAGNIDIDTYKESYFTNWFAVEHPGWINDYFPAPAVETRGEDTVIPITLVNAADSDLNERLGCAVHVLKPGVNLEQVIAAIETVDLNNQSTITTMSQYFIKLTDSDGNDVTIVDITKPENQLIGISKGTYLTGTDGVTALDAWREPETYTGKLHEYSSFKEEPGYDMPIVQSSNETVARVRLIEFRKEAFDRIVKEMGLASDMYLIVPDQNAAFLMQYPVGYVSGFEVDTTAMTYEANIEQSRLVVNLKTKEIGKTSGDVTDKSVKLTNAMDRYVTMTLGSPGTSSFAVDGETGVTTGANADPDGWDLTFGGAQVKASIPRLILLDYLEASYSPGVIDGTNLVCYGRKIRLDSSKLSGTLTASSRVNIGWYCGFDAIDPNSADQATWVYLDDLAAVDPMDYEYNGYELPYVIRVPATSNQAASDASALGNLKNQLANAGSGYDHSELEDLSEIYMDHIDCTAEFPGTPLNTLDLDVSPVDSSGNPIHTVYADYASDRPLFYAMVVARGLGENGLVSYITSDADKASTSWWNKWLEDHGFSYRIDSDATLEFLKDNYAFELNEAGIVVIDLETVSKIQQEFKEQEKLDTSHTIRTWFKIIGFVLVGYATLMMLTWALDTNVDMGINSLEKITFGKYVAVADDKEIPQTGDLKVHYVGFQGICVAAFVIASVGILLVLVDIVSIVLALIHSIGRLASYISTLISGG